MAKLIFPEDGWYRFEKFEQLLFIRGIPNDPLIRAGHYHQDLGHFSLYKTGEPILVDGGRRNYSDDNWGNFGLHPEAHNTITIDDYGVTPHRPTRFPSRYSNAKFRVSNLENDNIESRPLWKPMHMQPIFKEYPAYGGSNSEYLFKYGLCLPSGSNLSEEDLDRIVDKIKQAFEN